MSCDNDDIYFVGDVKKFRVVVQKDGTDWLGLTAVTLKLVAPDGTITAYAAQLESGVTWSYITTTTDLDQAGEWRRYWTPTDGTITLTLGDYPFTVKSIE